MQSVNLRFNDVAFSYEEEISRTANSYTPLSRNIGDSFALESLNIHFSAGWTGIVGPNGTGKSTIAKLACGMLTPVSGFISGVDFSHALYCEQQSETPPELLDDFFYSDEAVAGALRSQLAVDEDWVSRWPTLSFGERKRLQLAIALWREPALLVLDEPVNHLDISAKRLIVDALRRYRGTGIVVAHDRSFLDALCTNCPFVRSGGIVMRPGNYSEALAQQKLEDRANEERYAQMLDLAKKADDTARAMKRRESAKASKLSKRHISKKDHDAKAAVDGARLTGKDKRGARKVTLLERKAERARESAQQNYFRERKISGLVFEGEVLARDRVLVLEPFTLLLGDAKRVDIPRLDIGPKDRIALKGRNGCGKSTLLREIVSRLNIDRSRYIYLAQEISAAQWEAVRRELREIESDKLGLLLSIVHRLGSEPDQVIASEEPSPGEKRKLLLALGLLANPCLIIMDEPTNHLDMPSIEKLEEALGRFCGALLIVSHDERFVRGLSEIEWNIQEGRLRVDML